MSTDNTVEKRRQNMKQSEPKYTDATRTSSASFKPPMSRETLAKPNAPQTHEPTSSWFSPLSYIKGMLGSKPGVTASPSVTTEASNGKTATNSNKKKLANKLTESNKPAKKTEESSRTIQTKSNVVVEPPLLTDGSGGTARDRQEHNPPQPRFSFSPKEVLAGNRKQTLQEVEEHIDPAEPKYNPLHGENKSTILHMPDKKGTTSYRITTTPNVSSRPGPTLNAPISNTANSPSIVSNDAKLMRKKSASPRRDSISKSSRLRSKSTSDHGNTKSEPRYMPAKEREQIRLSRLNDGKGVKNVYNSMPKGVSSWHNVKQKSDEQTPVPSANEPTENPTSPSGFFSNFIYGKQDEYRSTPSPTRKAIESAVDTAIEVFSSTLLPREESPSEKSERNGKKVRLQYTPPRRRGASSPPNTEQIPSKPSAESSLSSTFAMISSMVQEKLSPVIKKKFPASNEQSPTTLKQAPVELSAPFHRRPDNPNAYLKRNKKSTKKSRSSSRNRPNISTSKTETSKILIKRSFDETGMKPTKKGYLPNGSPKQSDSTFNELATRPMRKSSLDNISNSPVRVYSKETISSPMKRTANKNDTKRLPAKSSSVEKHISKSNKRSPSFGESLVNRRKKSTSRKSGTKEAERSPSPSDTSSKHNELQSSPSSLHSTFSMISSLVQEKLSPLLDDRKMKKPKRSESGRSIESPKAVKSKSDNETSPAEDKIKNHFFYLKKPMKQPSINALGKDNRLKSPNIKKDSSFLKSRQDHDMNHKHHGYLDRSENSHRSTTFSPSRDQLLPFSD